MRKYFIILLIPIVSLIYGLPHMLMGYRLQSNYDPIPLSIKSPIARDEVFAYAPFVRYILNGNLFLRDVYVKEYERFPTPFLGESFPSLVFALLSYLTGSIAGAFIAADFIFPPMIFSLLFILIKSFSGDKIFSTVVAFFTIISRDFVSVIPNPVAVVNYLNLSQNKNYFLYFSRAFHPQFTFLVLLLAILFLFNVLKNPRGKWNTFALGISFGLLFYSYIFYWTYFLFFFMGIFLFFLFKRNLIIVKPLFFAGMIALCLASFYLISMLQFQLLPIADDFARKSSLHDLPLPLTLFRYLVIGMALFIFSKLKGERSLGYLAVAILCGVLIAPLSKFLVGQDLETFHYLRRTIMPFATIALFLIAYHFVHGKNLAKHLFLVFFLILGGWIAISTQLFTVNKVVEAHTVELARQDVFEWLKFNTNYGSVVGSIDMDFSSLLSVYTENKVYFPPTDRTIMPTYEGVERLILLSNVLGIRLEDQRRLGSDKSMLSYLFVYQAYVNRRLSEDSPKKDYLLAQMEELFLTWRNDFAKYKLDYVVVTPEQTNFVHPDEKILKQVAVINGYFIYEVREL